jgi:L-seryl-tRNA(Ser) seleniumtransferase
MVSYEDLRVRRIIMGEGVLTLLGGSCVSSEVFEAMRDANRSHVIIDELQDKAGEAVSRIFGSEAGFVTAGAFSAMVAATAACMMRCAGLDKVGDLHPFGTTEDMENVEWFDKERLLPDVYRWREVYPPTYYETGTPQSDSIDSIRDEVILQWVHHNMYDHCFRCAGAKLVLVGTRHEVARSSVCRPEDIEAAITDKTAAIAFLLVDDGKSLGVPPEEIIRIAHKHDIPVIADCAGILPPRSNLRKYIAMGTDLACYSGGKGIRGPNDTGFLVGRGDLIKLARLQYYPHHGICRGYKVDKSQIMGAVTALTKFAEGDDKTEFEAYVKQVQYFLDELTDAPNVKRVWRRDNVDPTFPRACITVDEKALGRTAREVRMSLREGTPSIWISLLEDQPDVLEINVFNLHVGEEEVVVDRLREELKR